LIARRFGSRTPMLLRSSKLTRPSRSTWATNGPSSVRKRPLRSGVSPERGRRGEMRRVGTRISSGPGGGGPRSGTTASAARAGSRSGTPSVMRRRFGSGRAEPPSIRGLFRTSRGFDLPAAGA
jgi:hypothetical protein